MEASNLLLLFLTTLAPNTEPPDSQPTTYTPPPEWNTYDSPTQNLENYGSMKPCFPNMPEMGEMRCPPNAHYQRCGPVCPEACVKYPCPLNCCIEGCFCDEGYVAGIHGVCVRKEQCFDESSLDLPNQGEDSVSYPRECGPREYLDCATEKNCYNYYDDIPCPESCVLDCVCIPPLIRGPDGDCIHPNQCPSTPLADSVSYPRECGPKEYLNCITEKNCYNYYDDIPCPENCVLDCVCLPPLIRGPDGDCIHPNQCPSMTLEGGVTKDWKICNLMRVINPEADCVLGVKPFEDFVECKHDDEEESYQQIGDQEEVITKPCFPELEPQAPVECPPGEHFEECGPICFESCIEYDCPLKCCVSGCYCPEGYVRGPTADCIPKEQCPAESLFLSNHIRDSFEPDRPKCSSDEIISCNSYCQTNCSNFDSEINPCSEKCILGCVCKPPKIRGPDGDCILPDQCLTQVSRPSGENLDENIARNYLQVRDKEEKQLSNEPQMEGSLFKCRGKNEYLNFCTSPCPDTCDNFKDVSRMCKKVCLPIPKCDCEAGYVRGPSGHCITPEECPNEAKTPEDCTGLEYYDPCGSACEVDCTNYMETNKTCEDKRCKAGCFCKEGYVRGPDGSCMWPFECFDILNTPKKIPSCHSNEYYDECGASCERNCTNYDRNIDCPSECKGGCVCKPPLVRGPDNVSCVEVEECHQTKIEKRDFARFLPQFPAYICKENERFTLCKSICPENCNNYNEDRFCRHICLPGCTCLPGYVLSRDGVCIKKEHCVEDRPEDCSELETFDECGSYCETDCFNFNMATRECYSNECRRGCFCKPGWVRSPDMKCVRPFECPRRSTHVGREW